MKRYRSTIFTSLFVIIQLCYWQSTFANEPSVDPDQDPFYSQAGSLGSAPSVGSIAESIDPHSGFLSITQTDYSAPGNGGLGINIVRTYRSNIWGRRTGYVGVSPGFNGAKDRSPLGPGWKMHMGEVRNAKAEALGQFGVRPTVELPDGSSFELYSDDRYSNGINLVSKGFARWTRISAAPWKWELTTADGTIYTFEYDLSQNIGYEMATTEVAQLTSIRKPGVQGKIEVDYKYFPSRTRSYVWKVRDNVGRTVTFNYSNDGYLNSIQSTDGYMVRYNYHHAPALSTTPYFLSSVQHPGDQEMNSWRYEYNDIFDPALKYTYDLSELIHPTGAITKYEYVDHPFATGLIDVDFRVVKEKEISGEDVPTETYYYDYDTGLPDGDLTTIQTEDYDGDGNVDYREEIVTWGWGKCQNAGSNCGFVWAIGLPRTKKIWLNGELASSTHNIWSYGTKISSNYVANAPWRGASGRRWDTGVYLPVLLSTISETQGRTYITDYCNHDEYGQPTTIFNSGEIYTITDLEYWRDESKNMVKGFIQNSRTMGSNPGESVSSTLYDSEGRPLRTEQNGVWTEAQYNSEGNVIQVTDANGKSKSFQWDRGRVTKVIHPYMTIERMINEDGTIAWAEDGKGNRTNYFYDEKRRIVRVDHPGNLIDTTFEYAEDYSYQKSIKGELVSTQYFDDRMRSVKSTDSLDHESITEYYSWGGVKRASSNTGSTTYLDVFGRTDYIEHRDETKIRYAYGYGENWVSVIDEAEGQHRTYFESASGGGGSPTRVIDAAAYETTYSYDILGNLLQSQQGSQIRKFYYDQKGFLLKEEHPDRGNIFYPARNNIGQILERSDSIGTLRYEYDDMNRLKKVISADGDIEYDYDDAGNIEEISGPFIDKEFEYDSNNRIEVYSQTIDGQTFTFVYDYDTRGNLKSLRYPSGVQLNYGYNGQNQLTSMSGFGASVNNFDYCSVDDGVCLGSLKSFQTSDGVVTQYEFDDRNRLSRMREIGGPIDHRYEYDSRSNLLTLTDNINASDSMSFKYDVLSRLDEFDGPWGNGSYTYDQFGNRTTKSINSDTNDVFVTYDYDADTFQLTGTTGTETNSFQYDSNGRLTVRNGRRLVYDSLQNLRRIGSNAYTYDEAGKRIKKDKLWGSQDSFTPSIYVYDAAGALRAEYDSSGQIKEEHYYLGSKLISKSTFDESGAPKRAFASTNSSGTLLSLRNATDASEELWRGVYQPFGVIHSEEGSVDNKSQFVGKEKDDESGLSYFDARYFDDLAGRFISPDPISVVEAGDSSPVSMILQNPRRQNSYAYSANNPYKFVDSSGKLYWLAIFAGGAFAYDVYQSKSEEQRWAEARNTDVSTWSSDVEAVSESVLNPLDLWSPVEAGGILSSLTRKGKVTTAASTPSLDQMWEVTSSTSPRKLWPRGCDVRCSDRIDALREIGANPGEIVAYPKSYSEGPHGFLQSDLQFSGNRFPFHVAPVATVRGRHYVFDPEYFPHGPVSPREWANATNGTGSVAIGESTRLKQK